MASSGLAAINPRLIRAVWESTRSDGAQTTGHLAHTLEVHQSGTLDIMHWQQIASSSHAEAVLCWHRTCWLMQQWWMLCT